MLTIAITTYNRKKILERMVSSFYDNEPKIQYNLMVYDDASDEYNRDYLCSLFPNAKKIERSDVNKGADASMKHMYEDFLSGNDDLFFNADADLIFSKNWCEDGLKYLAKTDGVISLFNTPNHPGMIVSEGLCEKRDLGAAGTFFTRDIIELFMKTLGKRTTDCFDWKWSEVLQKNNIKLYSTIRSYVQHIGIMGHNCNLNLFDYGENFEVDSQLNGQILNDTIEDLSNAKQEKARVPLAMFPFAEVEKNSRVVIYGAGKFGRDYIKQIESTKFCKLVGVIDARYKDFNDVLPISEINKLEYDKIIVALNDKNAMLNVCKTLNDYGVDRNKIVFKTGIKEINPT